MKAKYILGEMILSWSDNQARFPTRPPRVGAETSSSRHLLILPVLQLKAMIDRPDNQWLLLGDCCYWRRCTLESVKYEAMHSGQAICPVWFFSRWDFLQFTYMRFRVRSLTVTDSSTQKGKDRLKLRIQKVIVSKSTQQPCVCLERKRKGKYVSQSASESDTLMSAVSFKVEMKYGTI